MLIVTHEMSFARKVADRIIFMDKGKIIEQAPPEEFFEQPKTERAKTFLNILSY
ncbi:Glutamine transport ATP-binding protein GlnQ [compost metagenome]